QIAHGFADHPGVMLGQPVFEERIRYPYRHRAAVFGDKGRRLEPGVEAVPIHPGFNARQDLIPEVHFFSKNAFGRASPRSPRGFVPLHWTPSPETPIPPLLCSFAPLETRR